MTETKYTKAQAEKDGWTIAHQQEPRATRAGITGGGTVEVLVQPGVFRAEKTQDDHLITAQAETMELLLEQIEGQQRSLDNAAATAFAVPVFNDHAGDAGDEKNVGIGGVLPEIAVAKPKGVRELEEQLAETKVTA